MGSLSLPQGIFPTQESNPGLPHCRWILYQLSCKGRPKILDWVVYPFYSGSSWPRNWTRVSCIAGRFFTNWAISIVSLKCVVLCLVTQSCLILCEPMDCSLPGSSVLRNSPGKNTGVSCHALLQRIVPTQGLKLRLLHWRQRTEPRFNFWVRKIHWRRDTLPTPVFLGFPCGSADKEWACNVGDLGSIPGLGRSPGEPVLLSLKSWNLKPLDHQGSPIMS